MGRRRRKKDSKGEKRTPAPPVTNAFEAKLDAWSEEAAEAHDLVFYDADVRKNWLITVFVDRAGAYEPGAGVSVDELARVSRYLEAYLDAEEGVWEEYTLEVSSPGVERKLTKARHWKLSEGRDIRIVLHEPLDGKNVLEGRLAGFDDDKVSIESADGVVELDLKNIAKARLTYDFSE